MIKLRPGISSVDWLTGIKATGKAIVLILCFRRVMEALMKYTDKTLWNFQSAYKKLCKYLQGSRVTLLHTLLLGVGGPICVQNTFDHFI